MEYLCLRTISVRPSGSRLRVSDDGITGLGEKDFVAQLYKWANNGHSSEGSKVYNTIAPLQTDDMGYKGFGVLWWQIPGYRKLNTNMFVELSKRNGDLEYTAELFKSNDTMTDKNPRIALNGDILSWKELKEIPVTDDMIFKTGCPKNVNNKYNGTKSYLNWKMMVQSNKYTATGFLTGTKKDIEHSKRKW